MDDGKAALDEGSVVRFIMVVDKVQYKTMTRARDRFWNIGNSNSKAGSLRVLSGAMTAPVGAYLSNLNVAFSDEFDPKDPWKVQKYW